MEKRKKKVPAPAESPPAVQIDGYKDLLQTLRSLHADDKVIEIAERVVRERETKLGT